MYKKKLQDKATCVRPLHVPLFTAAALCSPYFTFSLLGFLSFSKDESARFICLTSCPDLVYPHQPPSSIAPVLQSFSRFMPAYLSPICSSFVVCITAPKFVVAAWRLYYEWTHPKPIVKPKPIRKLKLWLDTGMSAILFILSGLILVFSSVVPEGKGLQILLSLAGGSLIVHQSGYLSLYFTVWPNWLWGGPLICFIVTLSISIPISPSVGHTESLKITLLSFVLAEHCTLFIAYLVQYLLGGFQRFVCSLIWWNIGLCFLAWAGALTSLVLYVKGKVDFVTSLWVDNAVAIVWVVWLLWKQWIALQTARSRKEVSELDIPRGLDEESNVSQGWNEGIGGLLPDLLRQDSISQLVVPSAVHLHDSNRSG